jgi:predicted small lipoprotein YifL
VWIRFLGTCALVASACLLLALAGCKQKSGPESVPSEDKTGSTSGSEKSGNSTSPDKEASAEVDTTKVGLGYNVPLEIRKPERCQACASNDICDPCVVAWQKTNESSPYLDIVVHQGLAYVAAGQSGVLSFDLSADKPKRTGRGKTSGFARKLYRDGDVLFVASMDAGLEIFSIAKPGSVKKLGEVQTPGQAWDVHVSNGHAFVADANKGLQVIDVADPASPTIIAALDTPGVASAIVLSGSVAFVADGWNRQRCESQMKYGCDLRVIDVADPAIPRLVHVVDVGGVPA